MASTEPRNTVRPPTTTTAENGWLTYAAILVLIGGVLNIVWGIGAIDSANFFVNNAQYVISDLNTWGWVALVIGVVLVAAGLGIFSGARWAVWVGIIFASLNAITQLLAIPSYPLWSLALFGLNLLAIYGLIAHSRD